jgi:hypothetical protein
VRPVILLPLLLLVLAPGPAPAPAQARPPNDGEITRALHLDGRLWMLTDAGLLSSLADGAARRRPEAVPGRAIDMCVEGGRLLVVAGVPGDGGRVSVRARTGAGWEILWSAGISDSNRFVALNCDGGTVSLLTERRLVEAVDGGLPREIALPAPIERSGVTVASLGTAESLYVGFNSGEWGGGLIRVARRDGRAVTIARNATGALCDGPLNTDCDPVNGLAPSPWRPGCVVARSASSTCSRTAASSRFAASGSSASISTRLP